MSCVEVYKKAYENFVLIYLTTFHYHIPTVRIELL